MEKCDVEKGQVYEAEVVGVEGRKKVQVITILEKTCTVELQSTGELALAKIASLTQV